MPSPSHTPPTKSQWLTIGLKLILGITIASNLCIGALLYSNWQSSQDVKEHVDSLLQVQAEMSQNLREKIYEIQANYQKVPDFFRVDKMERVKRWVEENFTVENEKTLVGRENYKSLYNRTARRDLGKARFVVRVEDGALYLSKGLEDENGNFNDSVLRMKLATEQPDIDAEKTKVFLDSISSAQMTAAVFQQQMNALNSFLADEAINAEKTRTEILYRVEEIEKKEEELEAVQLEKQRNGFIIGGITIIINILVLLVLTRSIIERPLRRLTRVIREIQNGGSPVVPYLNRKDKIGILAHSIQDFRLAMLRLREEDERKSMEAAVINELINNVSTLIRHQQQESKQMADYAYSLSELAIITEEQSTSVTTTAGNTADNAHAISQSTRELQQSVEEIVTQIKRQNELVTTVSRETIESRNNIDRLQQATEQIRGIIKTIKDITQKSKVLAINATIEAARYGRRGAGFLVVANEMKDLSSKTETAADDITSRTEAIYSAGQVFVNTIYDIEKKVSDLTEITGSIGKTAENQNSATGAIAQKISSTSSDSNDVSTRIGKVNEAAVKTREMAAKVVDYSENISIALSDILSQTSEKLRLITDPTKNEASYPLN